jgi:hypothetical protein
MGVAELMSILFLLVVLAIPIVGIVFLVKGCRRRGGLGFPACGNCQYDVTATLGTSLTCPECGNDLRASGVQAPDGKRSVGFIVTGALLLLLGLGCMTPLLVGITLPAVAKARTIAQQRQAQAAATVAENAQDDGDQEPSDPLAEEEVPSDDSSDPDTSWAPRQTASDSQPA